MRLFSTGPVRVTALLIPVMFDLFGLRIHWVECWALIEIVHGMQWAASEDGGSAKNQSSLEPQHSIVKIPCVEVNLAPIASKADRAQLVDQGWVSKDGEANEVDKIGRKFEKSRSLSLTCSTSFIATDMPDWTIHSNDLYGEGKAPESQNTTPKVDVIQESSRLSSAGSLPISRPAMGETLDIQQLSDAIARQVARLQGSTPHLDDVVTGYPTEP